MWRRQVSTTTTKSWKNSLLPKHRGYRLSVGRMQKQGQWVSEQVVSEIVRCSRLDSGCVN